MRRVLVAVFVLSAVLVPAMVGTAQEAEPGIVLIMDASGSMNQEVGNGLTLLDEAKAALREIVLRIPGGTEVGLRVYGHRIPNDDKARGCVDTELIVPVGPIDRGELLTAIGGFDARGFTPIGLSLQEAATDLGPGGGTIILVSDGVDTCAPPDPCEVARQLAEDGITSHIHTLGLLLDDPAAVDQLQCIADAGNGTFTGVESVDDILGALAGVVDEVVEGGLKGAGIEGALQRELAPVIPLTPAEHIGLSAFTTTIIGAGEVRWWAVDVTDSDRHMAVNANFDWQPAPGPGDVVSVRIFDDNGVEVGVPHEVAGVIVEAPQILALVDARDWLGDTAAASIPSVLAVTDPVSMFPAWEPNEEFFRPTVERFEAAGLNGGVYSIFKRQSSTDPLEPGRYYVAVGWDGEVGAVRGLQLAITVYPVGSEEDEWREGRPEPAVRVDDGSVDPFPLDPVRWSGDTIADDLPEPTRAIEVWSAYDGTPQRYMLDMSAGEVLLVGWDLWYGVGFPEGSSPRIELTLDGPGGEVARMEVDDEATRLGFMATGFFVAPAAGDFVLTATVVDADLEAEPAVALAAMVLPADAIEGLEGYGMAGSDDGPDLRITDDMREQAKAALMAGLRAVADTAAA